AFLRRGNRLTGEYKRIKKTHMNRSILAKTMAGTVVEGAAFNRPSEEHVKIRNLKKHESNAVASDLPSVLLLKSTSRPHYYRDMTPSLRTSTQYCACLSDRVWYGFRQDWILILVLSH
ncbi:unnamed protein product, partial [Ectocarpus sp. 8 AP-2014]